MRLKELFKNKVPISIEEQKNINKEVLSILNRLYENIYHEKMLDNKDMFVGQNLIYKIYFNKHQKEVMSLRKALELNIIKYQEIITNMDYVEQNNINFYIEDDNGKIHTNIFVPNIEGFIIDGNIVYFESKDIKYNTSKSKLMN